MPALHLDLRLIPATIIVRTSNWMGASLAYLLRARSSFQVLRSEGGVARFHEIADGLVEVRP